MQRGIALGILGINIGASLNEGLDGVCLTFLRRNVQGSVPVSIGGVEIRTGINRNLDSFFWILPDRRICFGRGICWNLTILIGGFGMIASLKKSFSNFCFKLVRYFFIS